VDFVLIYMLETLERIFEVWLLLVPSGGVPVSLV